ncbi:MAG: DUF2130 domain-containing protein [Candidatus Saccharimonadales bacterium]
MNTIKCKNCGQEIEIDKALEGQIEARVLAAEHKKHEEELIKVKAEAAEDAQKAAEVDIEIAKKKLEAELVSSQKKATVDQELLVQSLRDDAKSKDDSNTKLREQLSEIMKSLREEKEARANADLEAQKKIAAESDKIREAATKSADEKYHLKIAEQEKKLADTQKALEDAQRKAAQGSQQNQGEVLELDLENRLREEFPFDQIDEVKKGQRGADIIQTVRNQSATNCGVILWESKNGKWQPAWITKFKQDIRQANANIGVIVSQEIPSEIGEMKHMEGNVWVVTPKLATRLAAALRITILQVDSANKMSAGKDAKMEALYQFLVGPEFRHRVEAIVENYSMLQEEIEKEKRAAQLRWSHQEKAIRAVIDNTIGMYGDLQGITNRALPTIKTLELDTGEDNT